jgi:hypothetical protein
MYTLASSYTNESIGLATDIFRHPGMGNSWIISIERTRKVSGFQQKSREQGATGEQPSKALDDSH